MGATEPLNPFHDFCTAKFLGREVLLKRHPRSVINLASSFDHTLVALHVELRLDSIAAKETHNVE